MANEEIGIIDTKANLTALLTNKPISQWLKSSEEERAGSRKVRDSQTNMRDRHGIRGMRMISGEDKEGGFGGFGGSAGVMKKRKSLRIIRHANK